MLKIITFREHNIMASTFHISIPETMENFVTNRVKDKNFKSRGSYVQELIRQDQLRSEKVKLTNMLLVGLASVHSTMTKSKWDSLRDKTVAEIANNK